MKDINLYMVGGAVRDLIRDVQSKDIDFAVEANSFDHMREWLIRNNFTIFAETPKYFTLRARAPKNSFTFAGKDMTSETFDFTLCRTERDYTDGRHPDVVEMGTIYDDLSRRDFTMNAVAIAQDGTVIDPFGGVEDIEMDGGFGLIRCVGSIDRLKEDGLRILRAIRFFVQLGFSMDGDIDDFLRTEEAVNALRTISIDRIRDEMHKAFKANSFLAMDTFNDYREISELIFKEKGVWLRPTTEKK